MADFPLWGVLLAGVLGGAAVAYAAWKLPPQWRRFRVWGKIFFDYAMLRRFPSWGVRTRELLIEGTNVCNAACVFCAYPAMQRPKAAMPMDLFRKTVDEWIALGRDEVSLTPIVGDPFVDPHLFERLDYLASRRELRSFHFYTNAILLKPGAAQRLIAYGERLTIYFSYGGFDRPTYHKIMGVDRFAAATENIRTLIEANDRSGSRVKLQVNLRTPKGGEAGEFWDYLRAKQARGSIRIATVRGYDNWGGAISDEALRDAGLTPLPPPVHRGPCVRLITGLVVLADGRVNACCCRDTEATLIAGDITKQTIKDIQSGPALQNLLERHERGDFPEACQACTRYESVYPGWLQGRARRLAQRLIGRA